MQQCTSRSSKRPSGSLILGEVCLKKQQLLARDWTALGRGRVVGVVTGPATHYPGFQTKFFFFSYGGDLVLLRACRQQSTMHMKSRKVWFASKSTASEGSFHQ